jgi:hypothetical protein
MKNYLLFFLICLLFQYIEAPNLVKNPSFEDAPINTAIAACQYCSRGELFNQSVYDWSSYRGLTPDIFTYDNARSDFMEIEKNEFIPNVSCNFQSIVFESELGFFSASASEF